jgi:hypothetical protein
MTVDGQRFDRWTRSLARGQSRRSVLRLIGAGTAGAALSALGGRGGARAQACLDAGDPCTSDDECCGSGTGRCAANPGGGTYCEHQPTGGPCSDDFECFGGPCFAQCVNNLCEAYCHAEGVGCKTCGECCAGLVCDTSTFENQVCVRVVPTTAPPTTAPPTTASPTTAPPTTAPPTTVPPTTSPPTTAPPLGPGEAARRRAAEQQAAAQRQAAELRAAAERRAEEARRRAAALREEARRRHSR